MVVGMCRIVLSIPGNTSLKGKRKVVRSILDRVRVRYHAASAEVDLLDVHDRAVLGIAVVSNDRTHAQSMLDQIVSFASTATEALVIDRSLEIVPFGERFR